MSSLKNIAIIGGTGDLGRGLAARLSRTYRVSIGSRDAVRAAKAAEEVSSISNRAVEGLSNDEASRKCDAAILTIPDLPTTDVLVALRPNLEGKLVISPVVPVRFDSGYFSYAMEEGSATEKIASTTRGRVAAALHTVPASKLLRIEEVLNYDVLVAADSREDFGETSEIVSSIKALRALYVGPLKTARMIESITPLLLNLSRFSRVHSPSIKIV